MKWKQQSAGSPAKGIEISLLSKAVRASLGLGSAAVMLAIAPALSADSTFGAVFELSELDGREGFVINGVDEGDQSGFTVNGAGDVNNEGIDDLIIGASFADPNGLGGAGERYVVFGGGGVGSGGVIELSGLDGSDGFVINGVGVGDTTTSIGIAVSSAGDINGDGVADLITGANFADPNGLSSAGESYVVFGGASVGSSGVIELSDLDGSDGFTINGIDRGDQLGVSVSGAGDINGDAIADFIVGASVADPNGNSGAGQSYVVFGGGSVGSGGVIELSDLDGSDGFVINGVDVDDSSGFSVSGAGDINGDAIADFVIGALLADPNGNNSGESYVVFGGASVGSSGAIELSDLDGSDGFVINGVDSGDFSGFSVSGAGDVNGDGMSDVIIGAQLADPNGNNSAGQSYVVFGSNAVGSVGSIELSDLDGTDGFVLNGVSGIGNGDRSGISVSGAGDVTGDGISDVIIGTRFAEESYVVFGGRSVGIGGVIELSNLDGSNGFVLNGVDSSDGSGRSVGGVGDFNGDAVADLVIGARYADPNGNSRAGESYVVFGKNVPTCNGKFVTIDLNFNETPGPGSDVILGTEADDDIRGRSGNDTICGMGGDDFIHGNSGNDWIDGGDGVDNLRGGQGDDVVNTGSGATVGTSSIVFGGTGDDEINGGPDADDLRGGSGVDTINGNQGDDEITGNAGDDIISGGPGDDVLRGGQGDDVLSGRSGDDFLSGGGGSLDTCDGGSGSGDLAAASCETLVNIP